jgi:GT2 family glycosyltransferase
MERRPVTAPPTVDVLIVSLNTKAALSDTLRTLMAHRPPAGVAELTVKVFDNGSTDGSQEMVRTEFPGVELVVSDHNVGFGAANNHLAAASTADYLLLLNSDVVLERDIVTPLIAALAAHPGAIAAGPRLVYPTGQPQYSAGRLPDLGYEFARVLKGTRLGRLMQPVFDSERAVATVEGRTGSMAPAVHEVDFLWATCWLVRRGDVGQGGLFDEAFAMYDEDLDFCLRARRRGRTLLYLSGVELVHLGGVSSASSEAKARLMRTARRRYYRTHHGRRAAVVYAAGTWALARLARLVGALPRPRRWVPR